MGLLFTSKNPKRISDNAIDKKDILKISKGIGFVKDGARRDFQEILSKAQSGGITREEVHKGLQGMILSGRITKDKARDIAKRIGLEQDRFRKFKDISESRESGEKNFEASERESTREVSSNDKKTHEPEAIKQKASLPTSGSAAAALKLNSNFSNIGPDEKNNNPGKTQKKSTSIWSILNSKRN